MILVESDAYRDGAPGDLVAICPRSRIVHSPDTQSAKLKDFGVSCAQADLVAVFEADCVPHPSWLRVLVSALRQRSDVSVVSGRTSYGDETMYRRALSLVDRSFDDLGRAGVTRSVSNNAALFSSSSRPHWCGTPSAVGTSSAISAGTSGTRT